MLHSGAGSGCWWQLSALQRPGWPREGGKWGLAWRINILKVKNRTHGGPLWKAMKFSFFVDFRVLRCVYLFLTSLKKTLCLFMHIWVCLCMGLCPWMQMSKAKRRYQIWSLGYGQLWAAWRRCLEPNLGPLQEQQMLFTTEASPQTCPLFTSQNLSLLSS